MSLDQERQAILKQRDSVLRDTLAELNNKQALAIVKAPPGSGKTTLLVDATTNIAAQGGRVAIAAQTNAQADDIANRLFDAGLRSVIRLAGSAGAMVRPAVRVMNQTRVLPRDSAVVVATVRKWEYGDLSPFDVVFVDEAWQMTWSSFLGLDRVAPRFVLIGDPGQIPPVVTVDTSFWETTRREPHLPAPALMIREKLGIVRELPASWRLPRDSNEAVKAFYDFDFGCWAAAGDRILRLRGPSKNAVDAALDQLTKSSMALLTLPAPKGGAPVAVDDELAETAVQVAHRLMERDARTIMVDGKNHKEHTLRPVDIGICATHRAMNARIEEFKPQALVESRVDTAERWQGLQRSVMVAVHPLSGVAEPSAFDLETGRLCVMASRHQFGLLLLAREGVGTTLEHLIVSADRAVGREDVNGRGHSQHVAFWNHLVNAGCCIQA